jgi:nucleoside phosphorylase
VEEVLKSGGSVRLIGGSGLITSIDQLPLEYDQDLVRHVGLKEGYIEIAKIDLDTLKALGFVEFAPDSQKFSLTPKARAFRKTLQSISASKVEDIPKYADVDQPWFTDIPKLESVKYDAFMDLEPDVVILTAVPTERDMVLRSMRPLQGRGLIAKTTAGPDTYYVGTFGSHKAVLVMSDMGAVGRSASILTTAAAVSRWNPKAVIAVGIAFGIDSSKQRIADVLISKTVSNYEAQRVQDDATIQRGVIAEAGLHLLNRFGNVHGWEFRRPDNSIVEAKRGLILSGEKLVDSPTFKQCLLEKYPEAIGGEMEGAGLYSAAEREKVEWIIVKAICDWADGNKKKMYQNLAAAAAVSLVEHVLNEENILADLRRPQERTRRETDNRQQDATKESESRKNVVSAKERGVAIGGDVNNSTILTGDIGNSKGIDLSSPPLGKCGNCGNAYSFTKWDMSGEPICPFCSYPLASTSPNS